jgi:putative hydrolase of the HAD superfamily
MKAVQNIIFDLGGVLLNINYGATEQAFVQLGVTNFHELFNQFHANDLFSNLETGAVAEERFFEQLQQSSGLQLTREQILTAWNAMLLDFRTESIAFLRSLRNRYKVYLLSNTNELHLQEFSRSFQAAFDGNQLDDLFDAAYYSHRIGFRKPNKEAFEWVLRQHGLVPEETLFIDDSAPNIEAAVQLGLQTIHLLPGNTIESLGL